MWPERVFSMRNGRSSWNDSRLGHGGGISCTGGVYTANSHGQRAPGRAGVVPARRSAARRRRRRLRRRPGGVRHLRPHQPVHQWMDPVDLRVYPTADGSSGTSRRCTTRTRAAPLYDWPGYAHLKFTYPPFAAMVFTVLSLVSFTTLAKISVGVNIAALLATIWMTLGGLGYRRGLARLGATLLMAAPLLWTEPVQRTLFLGQIEIVLMALIIWDQVPAGPAVVEGRWHRHRGRYQADTADLHPVPAADPQVPPGRRGVRDVRGDGPARVRRAAGRFQEVLAGRAVRPRPAAPGSSAGRATSRCPRSSPG